MPKLSRTQAAKLSPEERQQANQERNPTNALKPKCPAKVRNGDRQGEPCSRSAGQGTDHPGIGYCSMHGGNTPAGKKAAARIYGRQLILEHKERFGGDRSSAAVRNVTAEAALLEEVRRSVAMVRFLEEKIGEWTIADRRDGDQLFGGELDLPALTMETSKGAPGATDVQAWLLLYREERKHAAQVAKMCIDANISKRMVDLASAQGAVITNVVKFVLEGLGLTPSQASQVQTVVPLAIARANQAFDKRNSTRDANELVDPRDLPVGQTVYRVTDV